MMRDASDTTTRTLSMSHQFKTPSIRFQIIELLNLHGCQFLQFDLSECGEDMFDDKVMIPLRYCQLKENCRDYRRGNKEKVVTPPCFHGSFSPKLSTKWGINGESSTTEIFKLTIPTGAL
jgi:hypothetical protein